MKHKCDGCGYKGEHQEMGFRPFNVCTKGINLIEAEKAYKADKCPFKKTNFDRIKAMSVEEMAEFLSDIVECCYYGKCERCAIYKVVGSVDCVSEDIKKYLESEVQGE